jgi:nicotinate phosphoribosyltransferase
MHDGELLKSLDDLDAISKHTRNSVQSLPQASRNIRNPEAMAVIVDIAKDYTA